MALLLIILFTGIDVYMTYLAVSALYNDEWLWAIGFSIIPCVIVGHKSLAAVITDVVIGLAWLIYIGKSIYSFVFG